MKSMMKRLLSLWSRLKVKNLVMGMMIRVLIEEIPHLL